MVVEIKLDQAEFIERGPLSRDSIFNIAAWGVRTLVCLVVWLNMNQNMA